jgi:hypothetical protein
MNEKVKAEEFAKILIIFIAITILSLYLHKPQETSILNNPGLGYSDIVYGLYNPIFLEIVSPNGLLNYQRISEKWFREDIAIRFTSVRICPIPYLDYKFEYPPIVGALWFISTCISFTITLPSSYTAVEYYNLVKKAGEIHYYIQAIFISIAFIVSAIYMYKIGKTLNTSWVQVVLFAVLPSTVLYLIYNWDIITAMFILMSLHYLYNKRYFLSGLLLGLSISTKLLPVLFAIIIVYDLMQKAVFNKEYTYVLIRFAKGLIILGLLPYIVMILISYNGFTYFIQHHAQWYCENCIYLLITRDIWNPYNRSLSMIFILLASLITVMISLQYDNLRKLCTVSLISLITATALNYVFSPQMILMLTPIAVLVLSLRQLLFLIIADIANFGIMALFFKDFEARLWLSQHGLRVSVNQSPWTIDSPVQILATVRNVILILIMFDLMYTIFKDRNDQLKH